MPRSLTRRRHARTLPTRLVALVAVALAGCADDPVQPASWDPALRISGRWEWVRAQHSQTGVLVTPGSAGFSAEIEFVRESPSTGTFRFTRTGGPTVEGRFDIGSEDVPGNDFIIMEPGIEFLTRAAWISAGSDSLRLGGVFESGYNSTYGRLR